MVIRNFIIYLILTLSMLLFSATGFSSEKAPIPSFKPPVDCPIALSIHPKELNGSVPMRTGSHVIGDPFEVKVTSGEPGWYLHSHIPVLKGPDDEIEPSDLFVITKNVNVALDHPVPILRYGDAGQTTIGLAIELRSTRRYKPGTYEGQLLVILDCPWKPGSQIIKIPLKVDVACSLSASITGNKMYFHYGLPGEDLSATAEGEIKADTDVCLSLSVKKGRVDSLPMVKPFSGKKKYNETHAIPLVWALQENGAGWREPDCVSFHGNKISWELASNSDPIFYEIQCRPQPDAAQAPGDYAMRIILSVVPIL